jgi:hypothetical protein
MLLRFIALLFGYLIFYGSKEEADEEFAPNSWRAQKKCLPGLPVQKKAADRLICCFFMCA